jgi:uncharacterized protein
MQSPRNKKKIINDPVHGFINISFDILLDLIEHPYFQRLSRIRQLGLTSMVYPGATHTRFQHALGAVFLMGEAIDVIRARGFDITPEEAEAVTVAILLHDIGHGPFSHALEETIIEGFHHEFLSSMFMEQLNLEFNGRLSMALQIFRNEYPKKFLHQLVSSQLDMDRLDYLKRDSFFTGVTEGIVGSDRIIKMLTVVDDKLVIEAKGIYSIEKFLIARRLMYWQVYLHKTVLSAEKLLLQMLKRAKFLADRGETLFCTPALGYFLYRKMGAVHPESLTTSRREEMIRQFSLLDDSDIMASSKVWEDHPDKVLSLLCQWLNNRKLYRVKLQNEEFSADKILEIRKKTRDHFGITEDELNYFVIHQTIANHAYSKEDENIKIWYNDGKLIDITEASDILNVQVLSKVVKKNVLCYPKAIDF